MVSTNGFGCEAWTPWVTVPISYWVSGARSIEEQPVNIHIESREEIGLVSSCRPILRNHITVRTSSSELFSGLCTLSTHTQMKFKEKSIRLNKSISRNIFYCLFMILSLLNTWCILYLQHTSVQMNQIQVLRRYTWLETTTLDGEEPHNKESMTERGPEKKVIPRKNWSPHFTSWSPDTLYTVMEGAKFQV